MGVSHYPGVALAPVRRPETRAHLETAQRFRGTRTAASLQLARLAIRDGDHVRALQHVERGLDGAPRSWRLGALQVYLLRVLGRSSDARALAQHWRAIDPTNSLIRYELLELGESEPGLW